MKKPLLAILLSALTLQPVLAAEKEIPQLENPITVAYLKRNLKPEHPRLVLTPEIERRLKQKVESDPLIQNMYRAIRLNADRIMKKAPVERKMTGKRLLSTSREVLYRVNILGILYRLDRNPDILHRLDQEVVAACNFSDWNPKHFLDVGEMSLAIALAVDWCGNDLPPSTVKLAKEALVQKGLKAGGKVRKGFGQQNNWNQVCNGGMIAAAIAVAEDEPELATAVIHGALDKLPIALVHYGPDGTHPEGSTYWEYATQYTAVISSMLESAFGTDFGVYEYPGIRGSAIYRKLMCSSTGYYYNYGDCGEKRSPNGDLTLAWFAAKSGNSSFLESDRFLSPANKKRTLSRFAGVGLAWLSQFEEQQGISAPLHWSGRGINPVAIFRGNKKHPDSYYFGAKGGSAVISHGNMDAGSFILELGGVRWSTEIKRRGYNEIEQTGFGLWSRTQHGDRWKLLSKNNFGHSTLTVNAAPHRIHGHAPLTHFQDSPKPQVAFDLSAVFGDTLKKAVRTFSKDSESSLLITDAIETSSKTKTVTWQMITTADVETTEGGALLRQKGKALLLENLTHPEFGVNAISLNPPPHELDNRIPGLKRIEIKIPASALKAQSEIKIRLSLKSD